jgi:PAS domain S-box-containing protein
VAVTDENSSPPRQSAPSTDAREHEAARRLAAIVEASDSAIFDIDLDGSITSWNPSAARILGYKSASAIGRPAASLFADGGEVAVSWILERVRRYRKVERIEHAWKRADGSLVFVHLTASPERNCDDEVVGACVVAQDVTAQKRGEETLAAANHALRAARAELEARVEARTSDLSRARRELETLLYVAAHDLKEPLNALLVSSNMLADGYRDTLDAKGRGIIDRIVRASSRMSRLLADLLALTRANTFDARVEPVPGASLVADALEPFADAIRASGARVRTAGGLPLLHVHRTWATEAISSLIGNALKFTRDGEPADIEIGPYDGQHGAGIYVRDRGPGVPPSLEEKIFKLFQRGVGREVEGTGAGLAIVREIARRHGGEAFVRPRAGGGAEFIVTFGRARPAQSHAGAGAEHPAN